MTRAIALCLVFLCACKKEPAAAPPAQPPAGEDEVKPVYSAFAGEKSPLAVKLCGALHDLPEARRAACCSGQKNTFIAEQCIKVLSAALRSGGLTAGEREVDACVAAQEKALSGCGWVGPGPVPLAPECVGIFKGHSGTGELCRSSLECAEGQRCLGAGPTDAGRCGPPHQDGQSCLVSVDALAGYARQDVDAHHPECAGYCGHRVCMPIAAEKATCKMNRACGPKQHCDGKQCVPGTFAKAGESCSPEACAAGLRCVSGKCAAPRADGAACTSDAECVGGCQPKTHQCGMRCEVR